MDGRIIRILEKMERRAENCWGLVRRRDDPGYTRVHWDGHSIALHRLLYQYLIGPIPDNYVLHHRCHHRWCCNPEHVEPLDHWTHMDRHLRVYRHPAEIRQPRTHCRRGHPFSGKNLRLYDGNRKTCRLCDKIRRDRYRQAKANGIKLDRHKLTEEQRTEVLRGYPQQGNSYEWARRFGVSPTTIMKIIHDASR